MTADNGIVERIGLSLQEYLTDLTYTDSNKKVFKKVLLGFDEQKVKIQGDGVVCIVYVRGADDFTETFGRHNVPHHINTALHFIIRGTSDAKYSRAVRILDLLLQLFQEDKSFLKLENSNGERVVRDTDVLDMSLRLDSLTGNKLDTIGSFSLRHHVFK